jgi:hypothetical protein
LILGHLPVLDKTNEIPVAQQLRKELGLTGVLYILAAIQSIEEHAEPRDEACSLDHVRNRIEQRHLNVFEATPWLMGLAMPDDGAFPLAAVIRVHR